MALGGILVASVASIALNASYAVQHEALIGVRDVHVGRPILSLRTMLGSRRWLVGALLGYGGLALDLLAMTLAPLWLVQCVLATGLALALLIWSVRRAEPQVLRRRTLVTVALLLGVGLTAVALAGTAGPPGVTIGAVPLTGLGLATGALATTVLLRLPLEPPARHGIAAGLLYGATTVGFAVVLTALRHAPPLVGVALAGAVLAAATTAVGFFLFQRGLQAGDPIAVVAVMTATLNAVAIAVGAIAVGTAGRSPAATVAQAVGLVAICGAGALAARALGLGSARVGRESPRVDEPPGRRGRRDRARRAAVGRGRPRILMTTAEDSQVSDDRPVAARPPREAPHARSRNVLARDRGTAVAVPPAREPARYRPPPAEPAVRHDGVAGAVDLEH